MFFCCSQFVIIPYIKNREPAINGVSFFEIRIGSGLLRVKFELFGAAASGQTA